MKLSQACVDYILRKQYETKYAASRYSVWINRFMQKIGEDRLVEKITHAEITDFMLWVKENWAPKTLEYCAAILQNFSYKNNLNWNIKVRRQRANSYTPVTEEDHQKILTSLPTNEFRSLQKNIVCRILHESGCRISELCAIDLTDLNVQQNWAEVQTAKTTNENRIFWSHETHDLLYKKYMPLRVQIPRDTQALFLGIYGTRDEYTKRIHRRTIERWYGAFSLLLGHKIVPHGERHGKAHRILDLGGTVADVQLVLRHTNPLSSHKYLNYGGKELENRVGRFL